ncbi:hypothetical protein HPB50_011150 [Hyalomma asiaticum]|uniref:Uncharacterized protein n=1 Tax=Hyalomma asiaticum TaxID=266040 RepID=A0ACB7RNL1_HYAAI|nr:hypothetical protein HPB50_011150 [Hyalomma asiaticum]
MNSNGGAVASHRTAEPPQVKGNHFSSAAEDLSTEFDDSALTRLTMTEIRQRRTCNVGPSSSDVQVFVENQNVSVLVPFFLFYAETSLRKLSCVGMALKPGQPVATK